MKITEECYVKPNEKLKYPIANCENNNGFIKTHGTIYKIENLYFLYNKCGLYEPSVDDLVIGKVFYKSSDYYKLDFNSVIGVLGSLSFKNATKRFKPELEIGDHVIGRVTKLGDEILVSCNESGLGKLDGDVFKIEQWKIRKLFVVDFLKNLGKRYKFNCALGLNGRIWIKSDDPLTVKNVYDEIKNFN